MPKASELTHCVDCQEEFRRNQLNRVGRCQECALKAMRDTARQLHDHVGPAYEKWKAACAAKADRYLAGIKGE